VDQQIASYPTGDSYLSLQIIFAHSEEWKIIPIAPRSYALSAFDPESSPMFPSP
jgi:hypothetical protein